MNVCGNYKQKEKQNKKTGKEYIARLEDTINISH